MESLQSIFEIDFLLLLHSSISILHEKPSVKNRKNKVENADIQVKITFYNKMHYMRIIGY